MSLSVYLSVPPPSLPLSIRVSVSGHQFFVPAKSVFVGAPVHSCQFFLLGRQFIPAKYSLPPNKIFSFPPNSFLASNNLFETPHKNQFLDLALYHPLLSSIKPFGWRNTSSYKSTYSWNHWWSWWHAHATCLCDILANISDCQRTLTVEARKEGQVRRWW